MRFVKMQGVGNDFVVLDFSDLPASVNLALLTRDLCERHTGVGADGLLVLSQGAGDTAFSFAMYNPDGSEDMCGNGLRCAGLYAFRAGWLNGETSFTVSTHYGPRTLQLCSVSDSQTSAVLSVDMGRPSFAPSAIPFLGTNAPAVIDFPLIVDGATYPVTCVNTGSTHTVVWRNDASVDEQTFLRVSPLIETHPMFPQRTSVLWATVTDGNDVSVRIWERGAGETLGCGTGACAVAAAARIQNKAHDGPIHITSRGGTLTIDWPNPDADLVMTGPAVFVYEGNETSGN